MAITSLEQPRPAEGELTDIAVSDSRGQCPLKTAVAISQQRPRSSACQLPNIGSIDQVLVSPNSQLAFVTFHPANSTGGNNTLPAYKIPCTPAQSAAGNCPAGQTTTGSVVNVALTGQAGAPDRRCRSAPIPIPLMYSTNGDDLVHFINTANLNR